MVTHEMACGRVTGIKLLFQDQQQLIAQYTDDTSFIVLGEEEKARNLIYLLETFCLATGQVLNWSKSSGYWKSRSLPDRLEWRDHLGIAWADNDNVSKLLGAPFGLSLSLANVDDFLYEKLAKKLTYWSSTKINPTGRGVVANIVLLSTMFLFLSIWGGTKKGIGIDYEPRGN